MSAMVTREDFSILKDIPGEVSKELIQNFLPPESLRTTSLVEKHLGSIASQKLQELHEVYEKLKTFYANISTALLMDTVYPDMSDLNKALTEFHILETFNAQDKREFFGNVVTPLEEFLLSDSCILQKLNLGFFAIENSVHFSNMIAQVVEKNRTLQEICVFNTNIHSSGAVAIAEALKSNNVLKEIDLGMNNIGPDGATALADALCVQGVLLTVLELRMNNIGPTGATALAKAFQFNQKLRKLNLAFNDIKDDGATAIASTLVNSVLKTLNLAGNKIGANGATALSNALKVNRVLTDLNLVRNSIGPVGAAALGEALQVNRVLTNLKLRWNSIGDEGAKVIGKALAVNGVLKHLDLRYNHLGDEGEGAIRDAVSGRVGFELEM